MAMEWPLKEGQVSHYGTLFVRFPAEDVLALLPPAPGSSTLPAR